MAEPERWTRGQVAKRLGVSVATVRRLEDAGKLHPEVGERQVRLHDPDEVRALAAHQEAPREDALAVSASPPVTAASLPDRSDDATPYAAVFALLDEGLPPASIVQELDLHPDQVADALAWYGQLQTDAPTAPDTQAELDGLRRAVDALHDSLDQLAARLARLEARVPTEAHCPYCDVPAPLRLSAQMACCSGPVDV